MTVVFDFESNRNTKLVLPTTSTSATIEMPHIIAEHAFRSSVTLSKISEISYLDKISICDCLIIINLVRAMTHEVAAHREKAI